MADEVTFFNIVYVIMATCALVLQSPYLYCFQLLDVVVTNETLRNVVRAVTRSTKQLSMTVVLGELAPFLAHFLYVYSPRIFSVRVQHRRDFDLHFHGGGILLLARCFGQS